jgi:hypothetical protein
VKTNGGWATPEGGMLRVPIAKVPGVRPALAVCVAALMLALFGAVPTAGASSLPLTTLGHRLVTHDGRHQLIYRAAPVAVIAPHGPTAHVAALSQAVTEEYGTAFASSQNVKSRSGLQATYLPAANNQLSIRWSLPSGGVGSLVLSGFGPLHPGGNAASGQVVVTSRESCGGSVNDQALVELDQLVIGPSGEVNSLGLQFICTTGDGSYAIFGTFALNLTPTPASQGYYLYGADGGLYGFGNDSYLNFLGTLTSVNLNKPIVGMATTPANAGYWMVGSDGGVFSFGDAPFYGSAGNIRLNQPIVGMAAAPSGKGYWFVAADGGIFSYGDAGFYGSTGSLRLNKPIVGMASTKDGKGYWLVASDGGIFAFGDAGFFGSAGSLALNKPIVGMASSLTGHGYWLVASDGGIFSYGDAGFHGSTGATALNTPIVGMTPTSDGRGYWFTASDGGVFAFGDAYFNGSLGGSSIDNIAGMAR